MFALLHAETTSEYLRTTFELVSLIERINPVLCVLDQLFDQGADAVAYCGRKSVTLSPMDAIYASSAAQGLGLFRIPA
jgi:hypothetical protein